MKNKNAVSEWASGRTNSSGKFFFHSISPESGRHLFILHFHMQIKFRLDFCVIQHRFHWMFSQLWLFRRPECSVYTIFILCEFYFVCIRLLQVKWKTQDKKIVLWGKWKKMKNYFNAFRLHCVQVSVHSVFTVAQCFYFYFAERNPKTSTWEIVNNKV